MGHLATTWTEFCHCLTPLPPAWTVFIPWAWTKQSFFDPRTLLSCPCSYWMPPNVTKGASIQYTKSSDFAKSFFSRNWCEFDTNFNKMTCTRTSKKTVRFRPIFVTFLENMNFKPSVVQKTWSYVKKYATIFQMLLALMMLCFPGNLVTVYLQIQSPNISTKHMTARHYNDG